MSTDVEVDGFATGFAVASGLGCVSPKARSITFQYNDTWALKITTDGIVSNPDVPTDEGAKAMLEALSPYIRDLVKDPA